MARRPQFLRVLPSDSGGIEEIPAECRSAWRARRVARHQQFQAVAVRRPAPSAPGTIDAVAGVVIDPPVTEEERLTDALAAFGLLCDRAIEYLDLFTWADAESPDASRSTPA